MVNLAQMLTVDKTRLRRKLGVISADRLAQVDIALKMSQGLPNRTKRSSPGLGRNPDKRSIAESPQLHFSGAAQINSIENQLERPM